MLPMIEQGTLMDHLHWQCYFGKNVGDSDRVCSCLGHLGRRDKKWKQSYLCCATQGGQDKNNGECCLMLSLALSQ
jgi:hypothetical protein